MCEIPSRWCCHVLRASVPSHFSAVTYRMPSSRCTLVPSRGCCLESRRLLMAAPLSCPRAGPGASWRVASSLLLLLLLLPPVWSMAIAHRHPERQAVALSHDVGRTPPTWAGSGPGSSPGLPPSNPHLHVGDPFPAFSSLLTPLLSSPILLYTPCPSLSLPSPSCPTRFSHPLWTDLSCVAATHMVCLFPLSLWPASHAGEGCRGRGCP